MGILLSSASKALLVFLIFISNNLSAQIGAGGRLPASTRSQPRNMPVVESSNFICSKNGEAYECDVTGQPVSHMPGGAATRQELINKCLQTSTSEAGCERLVETMAPINSIPVTRANETTPVSNQPGSNFSNDSDRQKYEDCMRNNFSSSNADEVDALCRTQASGNTSSGSNPTPEAAGSAGASTCPSGQVYVDDGFSKAGCVPRPAANQGPNSQEIATIYQCESAKVNADSACDSESKNWMRTINQVSGLLGSQLNQGACGTLAAAQTGSAASLTLFSMQCGQAVDKCLTECRKTIAATNASADVQLQQINKDAADYARACNAKGASAKKTEADVGDGIQQIAQAVQACRASFGTAAVDPNLQIPDYVGKPQGDILAGLQQRNDQGLNYEGTGSGLTGDRNANIDLSDLVDDTPAVGAAKPRGMGQDPGGQQGSAGLGGGGGVGVDASSGRAANRKGNTGLLSNILSGFFGSGGGGLFGGGKAAGNRGGGGGQVAAAPAGATTPDLRQFLPGAKFDPKKERNIAGRIVSKDGIIGPHGNLWRDISNRYQVKRASLLP